MGERDRQRAVCTLGVNAIFSTPLKMEAFIRERSACLCLPALCLSVWPRVCSHSPFVPLPPSHPFLSLVFRLSLSRALFSFACASNLEIFQFNPSDSIVF